METFQTVLRPDSVYVKFVGQGHKSTITVRDGENSQIHISEAYTGRGKSTPRYTSVTSSSGGYFPFVDRGVIALKRLVRSQVTAYQLDMQLVRTHLQT